MEKKMSERGREGKKKKEHTKGAWFYSHSALVPPYQLVMLLDIY
jgi:hypothetical protein